MKSINKRNGLFRESAVAFARPIIVAGFFIWAVNGLAQAPPPGKYALPAPLDSWSFNDTNYWTSDLGYAPVSFTNITSMLFGDGTSLVINTNIPAWLKYNTVETSGTNEIAVASGSVTFWYAPNWSSTNDASGGLGPQEYGRLIEVGGYTTNSSFGWWSIYVDPAGANLYFSSQTNDGAGNTYTIVAPIDFTTNYWHFIALTYSSTNVSLYLDGQQLTNDPAGLNIWPGPVALSNGMFFGSDSNGIYQAEGELDDIQTYNVDLSSNQVHHAFSQSEINYFLNPWNWQYMSAISSAPSSPSTNAVTPDVITGAGYLQANGPASTIISVSTPYIVWMTNVTATLVNSNTTAISFTIQGGQGGYMYDVFATGALQGAMTNDVWYWMGQGGHGTNYTITISSQDAFLILGTPYDADGDGLTSAYELLVSHTDPNNPYSNLDGILDGWDVLLGLNPQTSNLTTPGERANYGYTGADWLNGVTGVKSGTITLDNEGNVQTVSQ